MIRKWQTRVACVLQYCTVLYCTVLYCTVLYCTVLYCTVLYCTVLYCTVLYCTVLYCTVLYCTVLYCTVWYPPLEESHSAGWVHQKNAVEALLKTLENMKYQIRTALGISKEEYSNLQDWVLGTLQGSGASPCLWLWPLRVFS